jgi:hypothetical protein
MASTFSDDVQYLKEIFFVLSIVFSEYFWLNFTKFQFRENGCFYKINILPDFADLAKFYPNFEKYEIWNFANISYSFASQKFRWPVQLQ